MAIINFLLRAFAIIISVYAVKEILPEIKEVVELW